MRPVPASYTVGRVARGLATTLGGSMLIGGEAVSRVLDFTDRGTWCSSATARERLFTTDLSLSFYRSFGLRTAKDAVLSGPGGRGRSLPSMDGKAVFRFAVETVPPASEREKLLAEAGLTLDQVDAVVCHQANTRIIAHCIKHLNADPGKFYNESGTSTAIPGRQHSHSGFEELAGRRSFGAGMKVAVRRFGAGLTWAA